MTRPQTPIDKLPSVVNPGTDVAVFQYASVSQVASYDPKTFGGCPAKWYHDKVLGIKQPSTKAQDAGTELHAQIEHYLTTGEMTLGPLALAGRRFIPKPKTEGIVVEGSITRPGALYLTASGVVFRGFIDVDNQSGTWLDDDGMEHAQPPEEVEILDWKSTSDISYAKLPHELRENVQMLGYAEWKRRNVYHHLTHVRLSHGYFQTKGARIAKKVTTLIETETVKNYWDNEVAPLVAEMKQTAKIGCVEDVKPNTDACEAFRGCFYRSRCPHANGGNILMRITGQKTESQGVSTMSLLDRYKVKTASMPASEPDPAVEAEKAKLADPSPARFTGIVPHDAPQSAPPASAEPIPPETLVTMPVAIRTAAQPWTATPDAPAPAPEATDAEEPPKTVGKKRGRPPGSKNKPKPTQEEIEQANAAGASVIAPDPVEVATPIDFVPSKSSGMLTLYVDCITHGVDTESLETYIADHTAKLAKEVGVMDIRFASEGPLGFGKWKGALAALVREMPPFPGAYHLHDVRESEVKQVIVETLRPLCMVFVRGR